jgi:hypothetical protein
MPSASHDQLRSEGDIARSIQFIRGRRVILDHELAAIYGVTTSRLNEQVKRNMARFPEDFAFRLNSKETRTLNLSQFATGSQRHRDPQKPPHAFTEHGAIMASTVLNSSNAIAMSLHVVRAFVKLREILASNETLARRLNQLEARLENKLVGHDKAISSILAAIRLLMAPTPSQGRGIGFTADIKPAK